MSEREIEARRARLEALRAAGIDPYPARVGPRTRIQELRRAWDESSAEALAATPQRVAVAGRVLSTRSFGKLVFLTLLDDGATIQLSASRKEVADDLFGALRGLGIGDFARAEGTLWRTRAGELTVAVDALQLLAVAQRPLPEKWHGLADVEKRYRQRYLDLLSNPDSRRVALLRSRALTSMRRFLDERGFLEVETPVLQPLYGGAAANPFTTHHDLYDQTLYLRISDELYLKRLIVGGLDRVYEIGHNFRNEGVSRKHNPEFTMMECYQAYADYRDMMELTESMIGRMVGETLGGERLEYQGQPLDFASPWRRVTLRDALGEALGIDVLEHGELPALRDALRSSGREPGDAPTWARLVDDLFSEHVEPKLVQPTFVLDYPRELSPLAKASADDPRLVERFEPFVAGFEVGNAFSELNDPDDQRERLAAQARAQAQGDREAHPMDEDYVIALEHGMPPTGGLGVGVDRVVMLLADAHHIREVILFPHLRPERSAE
jgi:lysyl-tRNA synthetase class 2